MIRSSSRTLPRTVWLWHLLVALVVLCSAPVAQAAPVESLNVSLNRSRVKPGDSVVVDVRFNRAEELRGILLVPSVGTRQLALRKVSGDVYRTEITLANDATQGLYVVHVWTGPDKSPSAIGKGTFLLGRVVSDFFIAPYVDMDQPAADVDEYLKSFRSVGGNLLIAHNLITPTKAHYPSKISKTDVIRGSPNDLVELILDRADRDGLGVLLSVSWDMTRQTPFRDRMPEIKAIARELYDLYQHHPSLAGFYSYQEGSGTYFLPYVREFTQHIKSLNPNLLTACAPHVDDPLLAGYLSTVSDLDVIIYQAGVMASYRTDNRKRYPFRRVKDFCSLGTGAKRLQDKIAINHVELFGYLENQLNPDTAATTYENIYRQILSAATVTDADGISFFTYHAHVYTARKKHEEVKRSHAAVADGVKAFELIASSISKERNPLAVYFPYSDWIIERWPNYFLPALDAFRVLGIPVDVLPYAPPLKEADYPYYPFHMNQDVLARLGRERTVLVLPNVSGFQQTDSDLIKAFVAQGGVVLAFGPQLPMGRTFDRKVLFGGDEVAGASSHRRLIVRDGVGERVRTGRRFSLKDISQPRWSSEGARVVATFGDGSAAVTVNRYGKGLAIAILPDAWTAAESFADLVRDVVGYALAHCNKQSPVDVIGTNEKTDLAVQQTAQGFRVAVINHNPGAIEVTLRAALNCESNCRWIDLETQKEITTRVGNALKLNIFGRAFRAVEFCPKNSSLSSYVRRTSVCRLMPPESSVTQVQVRPHKLKFVEHTTTN